MSNQHRVTPEQWAHIERFKDFPLQSALLEYRDRLATAEQRISELKRNHPVKPDSSTQPPELSDEEAERLHFGPGSSEDAASCARRIYRAGWDAAMAAATCPHIITSDEGTSYCGLAEQGTNSNPTPNNRQIRSSAPAGGLVERVRRVIADDAILAVAEWMQERTCVIANGSQWADMLREEVQRHG